MLISFIKKKPFPKKMLVATLSGVAVVFSIYIYEMYFFTFSDIEKEHTQEGPGPVISPTEEYSANAYYEPFGGAAGGVNVWVEIKDHNNDEKKTIYYGNAHVNVGMEWIDENTLFIQNEAPKYPHLNKSITLNVEEEIYHDKGLACQSLLMKEAYEACYQE